METKLCQWRNAQNITQAKAAELIRVSQPAYCRYETGVSIPKRAIMTRIVEVTNGQVTAADFYESADDRREA